MRQSRDLSPYIVQHVASIAVDYQNGVFEGTNDVVNTGCGCSPMTVEEFITEHIDAFQAPILEKTQA